MVRPDQLVKVVDFGIAKLTELLRGSDAAPDWTVSGLNTHLGVVLGTPQSMSPEQVRGQLADGRSDIFSLGVLLYEMIAHRPPFQGDTTVDLLAAILERDPPPLVATGAEDVPPELERIVRKCLAKDRERRYRVASDLIIDLKDLISDRLRRQPAASTAASIAVLPFMNISPEAENDYFCDGLVEELINGLTKIDQLRVAARSSAFSFKGNQVDVREIGRKLNVSTILEGTVRKAGDRVRITVQLLNAADGYHMWSERYDRRMNDVFEMQDEISLAIVEALSMRLPGGEKAALLTRPTNDPEAYRHYLEGRYYWNQWRPDSITKSIAHFEQAIASDNHYAAAYAGLADAYTVLGYWGESPPTEVMPKARRAAVKALEIDGSLGEAYCSLGSIKWAYDWDWTGAEKDFRRAIVLNPNYPTTYQWYAWCLAAMGRLDEALVHMERALELDPLSLEIKTDLAQVLWSRGEYDLAIAECENTLEHDANFAKAYWALAMIYQSKSMFVEARTLAEKAAVLTQRSPVTLGSLGFIYGVSGRTDEAMTLVQELKALADRRYVSPYWIGLIYMGVGEQEQAILWLERAYQERSGSLAMLNIHPGIDQARADPPFQDILRRLGIPPVSS